MSAPPERAQAGGNVRFGLTLGLLVSSVLLGGSRDGPGDVLLQLLALGLLAHVLLTAPAVRTLPLSLGAPIWLVLIVLSLPLVQMMPLPLSWWSGDATRAGLAAQMAVAGAVPNLHLALQPLSAERAFWGLLPAVAVFVSASSLSMERQRLLLATVLGMGLVSLVLGLLQLADGPDSALRFHSITNPNNAVGFFANRNHLASLLAACLPLALAVVAWVIAGPAEGRSRQPLKVAAAFGLAVLLILGVALTLSRAGLLLGMLGLLLSVPMLLSLRRRRGVKRAYAVIVAVALLLTVQFALFGMLQRLEADPLEDGRWHFAKVTAQAASAQGPAGAGLGSFRQIYQAFDAQAPESTILTYAHNDYAQLWLEAGWLFVVFAVVLIATLCWRALGAWRSKDAGQSLWAKAASISILILLLHSIVDSPLRMTGIQAVFGLLVAVLLCGRGPAVRTHDLDGNH